MSSDATTELAVRTFAVAMVAFAACVIGATCSACQKPIPYTPEQLREWSPGYGATDYPPLGVGGARDAGPDAS